MKKRKTKCAIGVGIILILLIGAITASVLSKKKEEQEPTVYNNPTEESMEDVWFDGTEQLPQDKEGSMPSTEAEEETMENTMIYMPGFENYYEADSNTHINLGNELDNESSVYLEYIISNQEGLEIYRTDYIGVGSSVTWNPSEFLNEGENEIVLTTKAYKKEAEEMKYITFLTQEILITIK